ncbi:hypothetical protein [Dongshaea marina]|uniref:hypothetical protein n=1 Tax=Dongshaea marina TaxID=2047966 RepID=UPI000D3ED068|nr:hypothetical protein [Dongshaea marina]
MFNLTKLKAIVVISLFAGLLSGSSQSSEIWVKCIDNSTHKDKVCRFNEGNRDMDIVHMRFTCISDYKRSFDKDVYKGAVQMIFGGKKDPQGTGCSNRDVFKAHIELTLRDGRVLASTQRDFNQGIRLSPTQRNIIIDEEGRWKKCWHRRGVKKCMAELH